MRRSVLPRALAIVLAATMVPVLAITLSQSGAVAADGDVSLTKVAPQNSLAGLPISYSLEATGNQPEGEFSYNLTFRDVLPPDVEYVPGSTTPSTFPEPRVIARPAGSDECGVGNPDGCTILIWSNVSDLAAGETVTVGYQAQPDPGTYPVGTQVSNGAEAYVSEQERYVPRFNATGGYAPRTGTEGFFASDADAKITNITPITIDKTSDDPEAELMRGVHDQTTAYTLTVTNNAADQTGNIKVVDYLPAYLEFLGCRSDDNSVDNKPEYPGSGDLTGPAPGDCYEADPGIDLVSVDTVEDPPGHPAGVYTRVEWHLTAPMAANSSKRIVYAVGVPLQANEMWDGPAPSTESGDQAANLDNNTGASTRELTSDEHDQTNYAAVTGDYFGRWWDAGEGEYVDGSERPLEGVRDEDDYTVSVEDVAIQKHAIDGGFVQDGLQAYEIDVHTSEYTSATGITIVDQMQDGLCPTGAPLAAYPPESSTWPVQCRPDYAGNDTHPVEGAQISQITYDPGTGLFTVTFTIDELAVNVRDHKIKYWARMRDEYTADEDPTVTGDSFSNTASLDATTHPRNGTGEDGAQPVKDESAATIGSGSPELIKRIKPDTEAVYECDGPGPDYQTQEELADSGDDVSFAPGSRVCFELEVTFPTGTTTKNPVLFDYLPETLRYEAGSYEKVSGPADDWTEGPSSSGADFTDTNTAQIKIGDDDGNGKRFVAGGATYVARFSAIVQDTPMSDVDIVGNLAKLKWQNTEGAVWSLRDQVDFALTPPPPVTLDKSVDGTDPANNKTRTYTVNVAHAGTPGPDGDFNDDVPIQNAVVWDVLPAGITKADISGAISHGGIAYDPADTPNYPAGVPPGRSVIVWTGLALPLPTDSPNSINLTYAIDFPDTIRVGTELTNHAGVRTYETLNNRDVPREQFPRENIDSTVTTPTVPAADDEQKVNYAVPEVTKTVGTSQTDTPGNTDTQAVAGETVTYTIETRIPAGTTVYDGLLLDESIHENLELQGAVAIYATYDTAGVLGSFAPVPTPDFNLVLTPGTSSTKSKVRLEFPDEWTVPETASATSPEAGDQIFRVVITTRVRPGVPTSVHNQNRPNTVAFTSNNQPGGTQATTDSATATVNLRVPTVDIRKTNDKSLPDLVAGGETVTFTVRIGAGGSRPPVHDWRVVDCVPAGLTNVTISPTSGHYGTTAIGAAGAEGCAAGQTPIVWTAPTSGTGSAIPADTSVANAGVAGYVLTYTADVVEDAPSATIYTNSATVTGSSLNDGVNNSADEAVVTKNVTSSVSVDTPVIEKSVAPEKATIGQRAEWTVTATIPANVSIFDAAILDEVQPGVLFTGQTPSIGNPTVTCTIAGNPCAGADEITTTGYLNSGGKHAWLLGDIAHAAQERKVTITYAGIVDKDVGANQAGRELDNTAVIRWRTTDGSDPASIAQVEGLPQAADPDEATLTVIEPSLSIVKQIDGAARPSAAPLAAKPGDPFTYTVRVTNAGGANNSAAHDVTIVDTVPDGIEVDRDSLPAAASCMPAVGRCEVITWSIPDPIPATGDANARSVVLTYTARLVSPAPPSGDVQQNVADIDAYFSLPAGNTGRREYDGPDATAHVVSALPYVTIEKDRTTPRVTYLDTATTWRLTIENEGDAPAYNVEVTDLLPKGWRYVPGSTEIGGTTAADPTAPVPSPVTAQQELTWTLFDDTDGPGLPAGATRVLTFDAIPSASTGLVLPDDIGGDNPHVNRASVTATDKLGEQEDNEGNEFHQTDERTADAVIHRADLVVTKEPAGADLSGETNADEPEWAPDPALADNEAVPGAPFSWTITLGNAATLDGDPDQAADPAVGPFKIVDTLPAEVSPDGATVDGGDDWTCEFVPAGGRDFECTYDGTIDAGDTLDPITVTATVLANLLPPTTLENTASVVKDGPEGFKTYESDDDEDNNEDTAEATLRPLADLKIEKVLKDPRPVAGQDPAVWDVTVTNLGPSDSQPTIAVTDTFPAGLEFDSATGEDWDCDTALVVGKFTCTYDGAALKPGEHATFTVTSELVPAQVTDIENHVAITGTETEDPYEPNDENDGGDVSTNAILEVTKSVVSPVAPDKMIAGQPITYEINVKNTGPSYADKVTLTDTLPTGLTYDDFASQTPADPDAWDCDATGQVVACALPEAYRLPVGTTATVRITADTDPSLTGTPVADSDEIVNSATADAENGEESSSPPAVRELEYLVDLTLTKDTVPANAEAQVGDTLTYTFTVANAGPSTARGIQVVDTLPAGLTYVAGSASPNAWSCDQVARVLTCDFTGTIRPGDAEKKTFTIVTDVEATAYAARTTPDDTITNTATVSTTTDEDDTSNNGAEKTTPVLPLVDLHLTKSFVGGNEGDFLVPGGTGTYEIKVWNTGPNVDPSPITVVDTLPEGLTYDDTAEPSGWDCEQDDQTLTCTYDDALDVADDVNDTEVLTFRYQVKVADDVRGDGSITSVENTAAVSSPAEEDDSDDNGDTAEADIKMPRVHVDKAASTGTPAPGETITYTVTVVNTCDTPSDCNTPAYDVTVVDTLPDGIADPTLPIANGGVWDATDRTITWTIAKLLPYDPTDDDTKAATTVTFAYQATLATPVHTKEADLTNTVTAPEVYSAEDKGGEQDTGDQDEERVTPALPRLEVEKTPDGDLAYLDQAVTWTVTTTNTGDSDAENVTVVDTLPDNWAYDAGTTTWWVVDAGGVVVGTPATGPDPAVAGQTLTWTPSGGDLTLAPGEKLVVVFTATLKTADADVDDLGSAHEHVNNVTVTATDEAGQTEYLDEDGDPVAYEDTDRGDVHIDRVDLALDKTGPAAGTAGAPYTWTITVRHAGTSAAGTDDDAVGPFTVTDTLPEGVTLTSATGTGWSCPDPADVDPLTREFTCTYGDGSTVLEAGDPLPPLGVTVLVDADIEAQPLPAPAILNNTATVDGGATYEAPGDKSNNTDDSPFTVGNVADLGVEKTLDTDPVVAGETITWKVTLTNHGPSHSFGPITLTDALPDGVTGVTATVVPDGWDCPAPAADGDDLVCALQDASMPVKAEIGGIVTFTFTGTVKPGTLDAADLTNVATVAPSTPESTDPDEPEGDEPNRDDVTPPSVDTKADLVVSKTHQGTPVAGQNLTYLVTVTNQGPSVAREVTITDDLPDYLTFVEAKTVTDGGTWTCNAAGSDPVACSLTSTGGDLAPGESAQIEIVVLVDSEHTLEGDPAAAAKVVNTVQAHSPTEGDDPTDTDDSSVTTEADLSIAKTGSTTAVAGQTATYSFTVTNEGTSKHPGGLTVTDELPAGMSLAADADVTAGAGWTCGPVTPGDTTLTCTYAPALPATTTGGANVTPPVSLTVQVAPDAGPATLTNNVEVDGGPVDKNPANDTDDVDTVVSDSADLQIEKTSAQDTVDAGGTVTYTVRLRNNGPSTADAVRWTDAPETGLTVTAITAVTQPSGWTCTVGGCTRTADGGALDPMPAGQWIEFTVTATVLSTVAAGTELDNVATVASDTTDPTPGNNESTEKVDTTLATDLGLTKTRATANVVPGTTTTFDLVVANAGPSLARGPITVTDTLPAGLTYQSHTGTGWTRDAGTGVFTYTGDLTVGVPAPTLTITVLVGPGVTGTRTNTAVVDQHADEPGDKLADNTDQATVSAAARADLAIAKSHPTTPVYAGGPVAYTLTVTNNGPSDHPGPITVTDTLPEGMSATAEQVAQAEGSPWSCTVAADERTVTCVRTGVLADQASASVTITATVAPDAGPATGADALVNHAVVSSEVPDDDPSNDEADDPTPVVDSADLAVAKTGPATVTGGGTASYTITITNNGPSDADDVVVTDAAPTGMTITSVDVPGPAWTPTVTGGGTGAEITAASLPVGVSRTFTIHVSLATGLAHDASLTNTATVDSATPDPDDDNDEDTSTSTVRNEADLTVSKTHAAGTITAGEEITYTVTPRNLGPSDTEGTITVTDTLPTGITATTATGTGWSCTIATGGGSVTCTSSAVVEVGDDAEPITIVGRLATDVAAGTLENVAVVDLPRDPNPDNDEAIDPATVSTRADLELDKVSLDQVRVGEELRYRFKVTNHGPSIARDVKVVDSLPAGLTYVGRTGAGWSCAVTDGDLVCDLAQPLAVGVTSEVTVTVLAGPAAFPSVTNVAEVTSSTPDDQPENNHDSTTTPIDAYADLALTKTAVGDLVVGAEARYRLHLRNDGPTRATAPVRITDPLPTGLSYRTFTSVTGDWTCSAAGQDVTCTLDGALDNTDEAVVEIVVDVLPAAEGTAVNTATASSSAEDPDPDDNESTDTSPVLTRADLAVDKRLVGDLIAGMPATWTIDIANRGPSVSRGPITVVDRLPAGVTDPKVLTSGRWDCSVAGLTITCTLPAGTDLPIGPADQIAVQATIPADRTAAVTNDVEITETTTEDPDPANDTDEVTTTPGTRADLAIAKSRVESEIIAGQRATYVLAVHNFGPSDARRVRITDTLPAGLTLIGFTGAGWTCTSDAQLVTCELAGDLADETGAEVRLEVEAAADLAPGSVVNVATVDSDVPDPVEDNNSDDDDTSVDRRADLEAIKTQVTTAPVAGQELTYRLSVRNHGPSVTPGPLDLVDVLPAQLTAVRAEGEGWACTIAAPRRVECARADGLAVDETTAPVTLTALVAADSGPATFRNSAVVDGPVIDENPANDTDYVDTTVADQTDVSLTKRVDEDTVVAGTDATYTLIAHNAGPSVADNVTVVDDLPAGMSVVDVRAAAPWSCSSTASRVVCERPDLGPGADAEPITVTTRVDPGVADGSELVNAARVSTSSPETDTGNNRATSPILVLNRADLGITKAHDGSGVPGLTLPYRFTVANHGPSVAVGPITVRDVLPAGLTYVEFSGVGWTCTAGTAGAGPDGGQVVTCTYADDLPAGTVQQPVEAPELVVLTRIEPGATGALTNTGEIDERPTDPNDDNDRDTDTVTVEPKVDLALVKSGPSAAVVGDRLTYTVEVSNAGPSTARDVVVTDALPAGLRSPSASGDGWACSFQGQDLTCELDHDLEVGGRAAITIEAEAGPAAYPSITNVASVTTSDDDIDPSNDTDDATTTLAGLADLAIDKNHTGDLAVGGNATYRLRVTNNGPHEALGPIVVTDTLPAGLTFVSGSGDGWACSAADGTATCTHPGPLASGGALDLDLTVAVGPDAYPSVTNVATVDGPTRDSDPDNNTDDDKATVTGKVSLGITKDVSHKAGRQVTYLITVTNNGPDPSLLPVKVVDQLPAELRLIAVTAPGWTCQSDPAQATCVLDRRLPVGESASFSVLTEIQDGVKAGAEIRNIATVAEGNVDTPPAQDDANVTSPAVKTKTDKDKSPDGTGSAGAGLPDTGGPHQGWLLLGLLLIGLGGTVLVRRRRTA